MTIATASVSSAETTQAREEQGLVNNLRGLKEVNQQERKTMQEPNIATAGLEKTLSQFQVDVLKMEQSNDCDDEINQAASLCSLSCINCMVEVTDDARFCSDIRSGIPGCGCTGSCGTAMRGLFRCSGC